MNASTPQRLNASTPQRLNASTPQLCVVLVLLFGCEKVITDKQVLQPKNVPSTAVGIRLTPQTWDFGIVVPGTQLTHTFKIINTTRETLHFNQVIRSCGCTDCTLSGQTIEPDALVDATIVVTTPDAVGDLGTTAEVLFSSGSVRALLRATAKLRRPLSAIPATVDFGELPVGPSCQSREVRIESRLSGSPELAITDQPTWCEVTLQRIAEEIDEVSYDSWHLSVLPRLDRIDRAGTLRDRIIIRPSDGSAESLEILVELRLIEPISIRPHQVFLRRSDVSGGRADSVVVVSIRGLKTAIKPADLIVSHDSQLPFQIRVDSAGVPNVFKCGVSIDEPEIPSSGIRAVLRVGVKGSDVLPTVVPMFCRSTE